MMIKIQETEKCIICESNKIYKKKIQSQLSEKTFDFLFCNSCDLVRNPKNQHIYTKLKFTEGSIPGNKKRVGDGVTPGREFRMVETALNILNNANRNDDKTALIFGAGLSKDHELIRKNIIIKNIKITDIENFQSSEHYTSIHSKEKFDIVIASEVIEHFEDPINDMKNLLSKIKPDGIVIASTNIHDGSEISRLVYPFSPGHVMYYSGRSLITLAKKLGYKVDFRLPKISQNKLGGPRKRYVIFYKNIEVEELIIEYFSKNCFALSE